MEQKQMQTPPPPPPPPHIVILPFPFPGHVKPMLNLAQLLSQQGFEITFINSEYNQHRLQHVTDLSSFYNRFSGFQFETLPDGLPPQSSRIGHSCVQIFFNTRTIMKPLFHELLIKLKSSKQKAAPTCVIADAIMSFAIGVGKDLGFPVFSFATHSPCGLWPTLHTSNLIQLGQLPFRDEEMDKTITCIPGMESLLRRRDLPSHCRLQIDNPMMEFNLSESIAMVTASALILNTFEELDTSFISALKSFFPNIYTIGPLHALYKIHLMDSSSSLSSNASTLRKEDRTCLTWLDKQPLRSVIYVSFGSLVGLSRTQLLEFWNGLVNSGKPFLWVVRPDLIEEEGDRMGLEQAQIPSELEEITKERGCMVGWAPQEEVLAHPAIGGFLSHCGWNSALESIYEGVPLICWPFVADQQVTSRCVSDLWKIGLDMKDTCDRRIIEKMVRGLMEEKREEFVRSMDEISRMARGSVQKDGSSHRSFEMLINDLRTMDATRS